MKQQSPRPNRAFGLFIVATLLAMIVVLFGSLQYATTRMQVTM